MGQPCYSIFNDVLGPIMTGPSSSHSAGCARIGRTAQLLWGRPVRRADVVFEAQGSYPATFIGQGAQYGFIGGLLGMPPDHPRLRDAVALAREQGADIQFRKADLGFLHPNQARIDLYGEEGQVELSLMTYSTGGGTFVIDRLNGFPVRLDGGTLQAFLGCGPEAREPVAQRLDQAGIPHTVQEAQGQVLFTLRPARAEALDGLGKAPGVTFLRVAPPVLPVPRRPEGEPLFFRAADALEYHRRTGADQWELALAYEQSVGFCSRQELTALAQRTLEVMRAAIQPLDPAQAPVYGFLPYRAREMSLRQTRLADTGMLHRAMLAAISAMEHNSAHDIVAAAPTAGSSGVLPSALVCMGIQMGCSDEELRKGLLAAGLTGAFIINQATFGGEVGACQAENGSASAMAAAGLVQLLGGTVEQGFQAAGLALQNLLGLVCDPVAGLTDIPCINRNVVSMGNAVLSANMVLLGFDPVIPLDETIQAMLDVGRMLPPQLRCTCQGGLCATPTGDRIGRRMEEQRPRL